MSDVLLIDDFQPRSELIVPEHPVRHAKFPVIDAHNHLTHFGFRVPEPEEMVRIMDYVNVRAIVNLSGGTGDALKANLAKLDEAFPGRFLTFCNVDWTGVGEPGWTEKATSQLEADIKAGARALKIFKRLGLQWKDQDGKLVMPDDPRISDIWDEAGELGVPVLIHTADPTAFFKPVDCYNERWDDLHNHLNWRFCGPEFPSFEELIESLYHLIELHPNTSFITAHMGCYPENLSFVSQMLDKYPNFYTDISERLSEYGRQPYSARKWFLKYPDRILFGIDLPPSVAYYQTYFRSLETSDEYFDPDPGLAIPQHGRWKVYGLFLPDDVLKRVYYDNAARLLNLQR